MRPSTLLDHTLDCGVHAWIWEWSVSAVVGRLAVKACVVGY